MRKVLNATSDDNSHYEICYNDVSICPLCGLTISPNLLEYSLHGIKDASAIFAALFFCNGCGNTFMAQYVLDAGSDFEYESDDPEYIGPIYLGEKKFDVRLSEISPDFITIYNQAFKAESMNLSEIAGMGYRKALEFLIKDYAIKENPDDKSKIEKLLLSACIDEFIADDDIRALAKSAAYIGNDETHYIKKHAGKDINDLKDFIDATQYFILKKHLSKSAKAFLKK